ncbi:hypothetical protein DBV15_09136 [Temnothorax longispinosus]|uniref:Uncharacterized protein n=1 Tax=Temnothorax longispinosus TaxID=300112 RepID=A0A4S2KFU5_9HYME|nr:hypothetical protein DBV15_09136 [Temnothorax longispinosus]
MRAQHTQLRTYKSISQYVAAPHAHTEHRGVVTIYKRVQNTRPQVTTCDVAFDNNRFRECSILHTIAKSVYYRINRRIIALLYICKRIESYEFMM